jgi:hypothetical protein
MKAAGAVEEVQVAAHTAGVNTRAGSRSTVGVGNLQSIYGPTVPDAFRVGTPRKRPT